MSNGYFIGKTFLEKGQEIRSRKKKKLLFVCVFCLVVPYVYASVYIPIYKTYCIIYVYKHTHKHTHTLILLYPTAAQPLRARSTAYYYNNNYSQES